MALSRALLLLALLGGTANATVSAEPAHAPLQRLPVSRLRTLTHQLRAGELALIELDPQGFQRQLTVISLVAASPSAVREVVAHPERYREFVRNMTECSITKRPDGTVDHFWKLTYGIFSIDSLNRYEFLPADPELASPPVEMRDVTGISHYRWEFIAPESGGGTIVVLYGYTDMRHTSEGGFLSKVVSRAPSLELGLALVTKLTLLLSVKEHAQRRPGKYPPYVPPPPLSRPESLDFLFDRGVLAALRTQNGRLSELSLIDRTTVPAVSLLATAGQPHLFSHFVPAVTRSVDMGVQEGVPSVELELSLPLMSWRTVFGIQRTASAVDMLGLSGDLRGARLRWDVSEVRGRRQLLLRANIHFDRSSVVMRQLYQLEPFFEYGVNAGILWAMMQAVKTRAAAGPR